MIIKDLGISDYSNTWLDMRNFTNARTENSEDELWVTQHNSVFTQGLSEKNPIEDINNIPVIATDRGGKITYHGIGQLVIYCLVDLKKCDFGIKSLVNKIEQSIIEVLEIYDIKAERIIDAPGVYVNGEKIAALGLKVKNSKTYHGLSLNINIDLKPFEYIDPCGYRDLVVTRMKDLTNKKLDFNEITKQLCKILTSNI